MVSLFREMRVLVVVLSWMDGLLDAWVGREGPVQRPGQASPRSPLMVLAKRQSNRFLIEQLLSFL
jgi:hypothetical protein